MMHQNFVTSFYLTVLDEILIVVFVLMIWIITKLGQVMVEQLSGVVQVVIVLSIYSDDISSNPDEAYSFFCKSYFKRTKIWTVVVAMYRSLPTTVVRIQSSLNFRFSVIKEAGNSPFFVRKFTKRGLGRPINKTKD